MAAAASVKGVIRRIPGVDSALTARRTSRATFDRWMDEYVARHAISSPVPDGGDPTLASLLSEGAVFLPGYFPSEKVRAVHDRLLPMLEQVRQGTAPAEWDTVDYREDGIYRLRNPAAYAPDCRELLEDEYLLGLASAYLIGWTAEPAAYVDYKPDLVHDHTTVLHMDTFRSQVKIFVFLSDIGPANAPLVYWAGSHRDGLWRRNFDYAFWQGSEAGEHGHVPVTFVRKLRARGGPEAVEEKQFCGPAGSVVLADTRGIHRASNLRDGYRLELVVKINEQRPAGIR